ncbi:uncharacterized protein [Solanum lycopersicum]|uniref:uncharacterized protein isoform X1 n=1 Tax=Solanum lycopersicum TaxID=4081 RepID=UPI00374792AC
MKAKYKLKGRAQVNAPGSQKKYVLTQKGSPVLLPQRCLLPWLIKPVAPSFSCFWSLIGSVCNCTQHYCATSLDGCLANCIVDVNWKSKNSAHLVYLQKMISWTTNSGLQLDPVINQTACQVQVG